MPNIYQGHHLCLNRVLILRHRERLARDACSTHSLSPQSNVGLTGLWRVFSTGPFWGFSLGVLHPDGSRPERPVAARIDEGMILCFSRSKRVAVVLASVLASSCVQPNADFDPFRINGSNKNQTNDTSSSSSGPGTPAQAQTGDDAQNSSASSQTQLSTTSSTTSQATSSQSSDVSDSMSSTTTSQTTTDSGQDCTPTLCHAVNDQQPLLSVAFAEAGRKATAFELTADRRVIRIEVFTGESTASSRLAIWNTSGSNPGSELVGQEWTLDSINQWQGANFEPAFSILGNTPYWVVWEPPVNAQANLASSGTFPTHKFQRQGQSNWQSQSVRPMIRIYCCAL